MRICLLGESHGPLDEAMRNTTHYLHKYLSREHDVLAIDLRTIYKGSEIQRVKRFRPDIIHYIHGPTVYSFLISRLLSKFSDGPKVVLHATNPDIPIFLRGIPVRFKPDIVLVMSPYTKSMFDTLGLVTQYLPVGVDTDKFRPMRRRDELRVKYGLDLDKYLLLHIGSISLGRNLDAIRYLKDDETDVLIIGRTSRSVDEKLFDRLVDAGCIVIRDRYFGNIEEIYNLADCYIYPVIYRLDWMGRNKADSIDLPMTILEAMACNLPVISTRYGGMPYFFREGQGLYLRSDPSEFREVLEQVRYVKRVSTRDIALRFSWRVIVDKLIEIYRGLLSHG
jgi:glycosyltransferase involved in cell wall biosynthesis